MRYVLIGILLAAGAVYAQDTYRWTDKDGKVYYGANPPKGAIDPKKVANRMSSSTAPGTGNKAASGSAGAAPKSAPFQTVVKDEDNVRKKKEDSEKAPR